MASQVKAYVLKDISKPIANWGVFAGKAYSEIGSIEEEYYHNLIAFTTVEYNPADGLVYCGITACDNDILFTFDPASKKFESLNYQKVGEKYDIKIHRSLILDDDGMMYGATAGLPEPFEYLKAPGGKVFSLNTKTKEIKILDIPCPHDYIQCIAMDKKRKIIYGYTWPLNKFFRFDLATGKSTNFEAIGAGPHIPAVDDAGNLWGSWATFGSGDKRLMRYHPDEGVIDFNRTLLPKLHGNDGGDIDGMVNGGDGYIYVGTVSGGLVRLDPKNAEFEYLGKPYPGTRLAGLCIGKDGLLYGGGGENYNTYIFAYDRESKKFYPNVRLHDTDSNAACVIVHHICITDDGTVYAAETDNLERSGYLFECKPGY
jgi:outer membrane protein assembly factor BamB